MTVADEGRRWGPVRTSLQRHVDAGHVPGAVAAVAEDGRAGVVTVGKASFGGPPMRPDTLFRIASLTKPVVAVATMVLVEDGVLRLDAPIRAWIPELARPRVLARPGGEIDDTVPAARPILVRHLLTMTAGVGTVLGVPERTPHQRAFTAAGLDPGPDPPVLSPEEWLARLGSVPLLHQPGDGFLYHTAFDVLGVLLARAHGGSLGDLLRERVLEPLRMTETAFCVTDEQAARLSTLYATAPDGMHLQAYDEPATSRWRGTPALESGGAGLISTVGDYLAFCRMLAREGEGLLSPQSIRAMTTDALTPGQRDAAQMLLGRASSWGLGFEINQRRVAPWMTPGRFGWGGGTGTAAYVDPALGRIGILLTQRLLDSPTGAPVAADFWRAVYTA